VTRVLITNDDGISSEGLRCLAVAALKLGYEVVVAAPFKDLSGASASLSATRTEGAVLVEKRNLEGLDGSLVLCVDAAPAFIAHAALRGSYGDPPDVIWSGINRGANTGNAILHSGTVGAALTARAQGTRSMAVSLASPSPQHWATAGEVASHLAPILLSSTAPVMLNVNVPDVAGSQLRGLRRASLARFGTVQTTPADPDRGQAGITVSDFDPATEPCSDAALVVSGFATVTPLDPICEAAHVAVTGLELL
jgi:5'-nucleotidase